MLYAAESLLALALAALIVSSTAWFQRWLEHRVVAALEHLTGGRVEIAGFRFRPWLFQLSLRNLVIHGEEGAGQPPLIFVRNIVTHLGPEELLRQHIHLHSLDMDDLEVHVHTGAGGGTNLPELLQQATPEESLRGLMNLSIGRLTVSRSAFFWNDQRQPFEMNAGKLAILLRMAHGHYTGSISSTGTSIRLSRWALPPLNFASRFEVSRNRLSFSSFTWQAEWSRGQAALNIRFLASPQAAGAFVASAIYPHWREFSAYPSSGREACS